jgi:hypothetical protein
MRLMVRWGTGVAAGLAAVIVLAVSIHRPAPEKALAKGDVNGDGAVNIVDALALAKHVANHDGVEKEWDLNGDGVVDQKDVDVVAMGAVSLKGAGVARNSLPKMRELGIDRQVPEGFAWANGRAGDVARGNEVNGMDAKTFAEANPTKNGKEALR